MKRRILIGLAFTEIASVANAHIMPEQASPNPISVTVHFNESADVTFNFEQAGVASIDFLISGKTYTAVVYDCKPIVHVRFDTALLTQGPPRAPEDDFKLTFRMGEETDKRFGELPLVQISFKGGKVSEMRYSMKTTAIAESGSQLCPGSLNGRSLPFK
jgi:hypothetical protein